MLLFRSSVRYVLRQRWLAALSILGVALGVAVIVAVDIANTAAQRSFLAANEIINGRTTHRLVAGPNGVDENLYTRLRVEAGIRNIAPVVIGEVESQRAGDAHFRLLGIDVFAERAFRTFTQTGPAESVSTSLLATRNAVLIAPNTASRFGIGVGDTLPIAAGDTRANLTVVGILQPNDDIQRTIVASLLVVDIATAQILLGMENRISYIDVIAADASALDEIRAALPSAVEIVTAASAGNAQREMTRAFEINLTALSLLALLIGLFLIYNAVTFSVIRRRVQLGVLCTLGVSRVQIFTTIITEAGLIGIIATGFGIVAGIALANGLVELISRTISDLYFSIDVAELPVPLLTVAKAAGAGILATIVVACIPAWEATRTAPASALRRSVIERQTHRGSRIAVKLGLVLMAVGGVLLSIAPRSLVMGFAGLFFLVIGYAVMTPQLMVWLLDLARYGIGALFGLPGRLAVRGLVAALSRTGMAVAALTVASAAAIGVGVMIASFRDSVNDWLTARLLADVYVAASGGPSRRLDPDLVQQLTALPGVTSAALGRWATIESEGARVELFAIDIGRTEFARFEFTGRDSSAVWPEFQRTDSVIVSEPYAYRHRIGAGDSIALRTGRGERDFTVVGVYFDYAADGGVVAMHRQTYLEHWQDPALTSVTLYLSPGVAADSVIDTIRGWPSVPKSLRVRSAQQLRDASLRVFDRTFSVTNVLRALALIVAAVGILAALMSIQLERSKEFALLRVVGMTPAQLFRLIAIETGIMGAVAAVLSIPIGMLLAWVLVRVINRRSFGWSIEMSIAPEVIAQTVLLAIAVALLAAVYPALRGAGVQPALALREE